MTWGENMDEALTYIGDIRIEGYSGDYIFETIKKTGNFYEIDILNKWSPVLGNPDIIFDIGSNIGNHAVFWASQLKPSSIYAFEPCPINFSCLQKNIHNNNLVDIVIPIQKGVGDHEGYASISNVDESNLGGTSIAYTADGNEETAIQIIDLDTFVKENSIKNVDFVKIDTEGFEIKVLHGMKDIIAEHHPAIWVEVSYPTYSEVINKLRKEGYVLHDIEQFNLLFLHPSRHGKVDQVDSNKVLDGFFKYLEKTNQYYKAYTTSKKWLEERNRTLEQLKKNYQKQIEEHNRKLQQLKDSYQKEVEEQNKTLEQLKISHQKLIEEYNRVLAHLKEIEKLKNDYERQINEGKDLQDRMSKYLLEDIEVFDNQINVMESLKQYVRKLQTQNSYLIAENQEYRRKFAKITATWYGRFAIKIYKFLQQLKKKIKYNK